MKKILITGAKGFLGSHISKYFKNLKFETYGIGHGDLLVEECRMIGLDYWFKSDVNIKAIKEINEKFDVVIHCGGSGSVGFSMENPYEDFKKTVDGTLEVLEYIRLYNPNAHLIYPSSPAVLGECNDEPIAENYIGKPVSPYGYHKKIAEDLCQSYSEKYDIKVSIVRLFSVYGNGLRKQLLWDAYNKMILSNSEVEFWGTGSETRDFIHVEDVMDLFLKLLSIEDKFIILNGGSGVKHSVYDVVNLIKEILHSDIKIVFNNQRNLGNPIYYHSDISKTKKLGWEPVVNFNQGVKEYIKWVKKQK
ncbi:MAG: NAD-dependent epimerase/dehydratase family protein [Sulfurimonas sp.]|uniref:NAD-dependent epimerase/dehydratase family protein n=1 Tax=Sulfurimonas sp. TaxID=2022749 RepID=UPI002632D3FA|nr:NAD-dependent epimerase/dehydratase family protein [Sulfurimonas sp.]MDD5400395.1 NAD-dependent epimerase/dehydratase family protein [Sulfurimonas sp.]